MDYSDQMCIDLSMPPMTSTSIRGLRGASKEGGGQRHDDDHDCRCTHCHPILSPAYAPMTLRCGTVVSHSLPSRPSRASTSTDGSVPSRCMSIMHDHSTTNNNTDGVRRRRRRKRRFMTQQHNRLSILSSLLPCLMGLMIGCCSAATSYSGVNHSKSNMSSNNYLRVQQSAAVQWENSWLYYPRSTIPCEQRTNQGQCKKDATGQTDINCLWIPTTSKCITLLPINPAEQGVTTTDSPTTPKPQTNTPLIPPSTASPTVSVAPAIGSKVPTTSTPEPSTAKPTFSITSKPSNEPSKEPTLPPSREPSKQPTLPPSREPSREPTDKPSDEPSLMPSGSPTRKPTKQPTTSPSKSPSLSPTNQPTTRPSKSPTVSPSSTPSMDPTAFPSGFPSSSPTYQPSPSPSLSPTITSRPTPLIWPSYSPTTSTEPTSNPTLFPSEYPSSEPTETPTVSPTTEAPTTSSPTSLPSNEPSQEKQTEPPTKIGVPITTSSPTSSKPTMPRRVYRVPSSMKLDGDFIDILDDEGTIGWKSVTEGRIIDSIWDMVEGEAVNLNVAITIINQEKMNARRMMQSGAEAGEQQWNKRNLLRRLESTSSSPLNITFTTTIKFDSDSNDWNPNRMVASGFESIDQQNDYIDALKQTGHASFQNVNGMAMEVDGELITGEDVINPAPAVPPPADNTKYYIIGGACGGALLLAIVGSLFYKMKKGNNNDETQQPFPKSSVSKSQSTSAPPPGAFNQPQAQTPQYTLSPPTPQGDFGVIESREGEDDVSTLGDPYGTFDPNIEPRTDETVGESLISTEGELYRFGVGRERLMTGDSRSRVETLTTTTGGGTPLNRMHFVDDTTVEDAFRTPNINGYGGLGDGLDGIGAGIPGASPPFKRLTVVAPRGKLGIVVNNENDGDLPIVHAVKDESVLYGKVNVGDLLISVDEVDCRGMSAVNVSRLISSRSQNPTRMLILLRRNVSVTC